VVARFVDPFDRFAPVAFASAIDSSNLHQVVLAFDEGGLA
jgi:hypothetical protein